MDFKDFKQSYLDEALELINSLDSIMLNLEKDIENIEHIEHIFRVMHTLKGSCSMFGFDQIANITHNLESLYDLVREKKIEISNQIIEITFETIDVIRLVLISKGENENFGVNAENVSIKILSIIQKSGNTIKGKNIAKQSAPKGNQKHTWNIIFYPNENILTRNIKLLNTFHDLFQLGEYHIYNDSIYEEKDFWNIFLITDKQFEDIEDALFFIIDYCKIIRIADFNIFNQNELNERDSFNRKENVNDDFEIFISEPSEKKTIEPKSDLSNQLKLTSNRIIVDAEKLDTLIYLVGELVTSKSDLILSIESKDFEKINSASENIDKLSRLFRDNALSIRLVSLQDLLNRFRRLVRDLAKQLNKNIDFEIIGEDTELDKSIIEAITEPVMHLIRNCIDHGIETPHERKMAGKEETGMIKFIAFKKGNFVFIQISDNGRGIDKQKILNKAIEKKIISENSQLSDKEIYDLIFIPGFSTAENLTQVSGRGVGMDIVRKKITEIRGSISIDSEFGLGTSFTLKLQQTIAIIDTLLISTDSTKFSIPIEDIENCDIISTKELFKNKNKQLFLNNELIPFFSIRKEFKFKTVNPLNHRVIIINKQEKKYAIITDNIIGEYQAVIKPIESSFYEQDFFAGASILGDGSITLLMDTEKLKNYI